MIFQNFFFLYKILAYQNVVYCLTVQVLIELICKFIIQFSIFMLREFSNWCLIFSCFSAVFENSAIISSQESYSLITL